MRELLLYRFHRLDRRAHRLLRVCELELQLLALHLALPHGRLQRDDGSLKLIDARRLRDELELLLGRRRSLPARGRHLRPRLTQRGTLVRRCLLRCLTLLDAQLRLGLVLRLRIGSTGARLLEIFRLFIQLLERFGHRASRTHLCLQGRTAALRLRRQHIHED